ncbi:MAG: hypothetical protein WC545_00245 [Patescibacteria group bacterium]|jgi:hypothetical protein
MNRIYKLINKDDLDFIIGKLQLNKSEYYAGLCSCIDELADVPGVKLVCDNLVKDFRNGNANINRCFTQLLLAYKFKERGILNGLELSNPPLDFLLNDGMGIELIRIGDDNNLLLSKIEKFIDQCDLSGYRDFEIEIKLKSNEPKIILASLKRDFPVLLEKNVISNEYYEMTLREKGDLVASLLPDNIWSTVCLSSRTDYNLKLWFMEKRLDIIEVILNKNTRSAARNSSILIVDLSESSSYHYSLSYIKTKLDEIKNGIPKNNLAIIMFVNFFFKDKVIKCDMEYIKIKDDDERANNFENIFLKSKLC